MSQSDPLVWTLSEVASSIVEESQNSRYFIQLPKFQRSIVWTESQIKKLVDSIYKGYPIGSLLAYQTDQTRSGKIVLHLVDGLQRVTAISRFVESPLKYAPLDLLVSANFVAEVTSIVFGEVNEKNKGLIEQRFRSWFDSATELKYGAKFNFALLANHLAEDDKEAYERLIVFNTETKSGDELLGTVLEGSLEARQYKVPLNIYSGPIDNVPTIFERVNSQGTKLSKYEILAANWIRSTVEVRNADVKEAIADKYRVMLESGYEVDGVDEESGESADYNLYEYLFGLGKVLSRRFPTLFHSGEAADEDSPVAFQIFTVAFELPVAKMGSLAEKMPRLTNGDINISRVEEAVLTACKLANDALSQYLTLRLNEKSQGDSGVSQNQAISMVTAILANCYGKDFANFDAKLAKQIAHNLPGHFLVDLLRNAWGNAGDSTLFERTWFDAASDSAGASRKPDLRPSDYYLRPVGADSLRTAFDLWNSTLLSARQKERVRFAKETKPFLKFVYSTLVTSQEDKGTQFELEHVYPVAVLKEYIATSGIDGLPMAAVGNLMLLPKDINRIKKKNLLGDYVLGNPAVRLSSRELERLQAFLISPDLTEITMSSGIDTDRFTAFCNTRSGAMIDHVIVSLRLS